MNNRRWLNLILIAGVLLVSLSGFVELVQAASPAVAFQAAEPTETESNADPIASFSPEQTWPVETGHNLPSASFAGRPLLAFTPSLTVTKHAVNDGDITLRPGERMTYTIAISNGGDTSATGVVVSDTFPAATSYVTSSIAITPTEAGGTAGSPSSQPTLASDITVAAGSVVTVSYTVVVDSNVAHGTQITNTAAVTSTEDTNPVTASIITPVANEVNLSISKSNEQTAVIPGQVTTYTITVTNTGPGGVTGAVVTDTFPSAVSGITWTCVETGGSSCPPSGTGNINAVVDIPAAARVTFSAAGQVGSGATGTLANTAWVSPPAGVSDLTPDNNNDSDSTPLTPQADLAITKTAGPNPVTAGRQITYTLVITNNGPSDAANVQVVDDLPDGVSYISATISGGNCDHSSGTVTCNRAGLVDGATTAVTIWGLVASSFVPGPLSNTASVSSSTTDSVPGNNSATAGTTVQRQADLTITKSDEPDPMLVQNLLTYTIWITNNGPSDAANVQVADTLPDEVTYVPAGSGPACSLASGVVTCNPGTLESGDSTPVIIVVRPQTTGTKTNNASVSSSATDPFPGNNSASTTTTVNPKADVWINKTVVVEGPVPLNPPVAGLHSLLYTLVVNNAGPSTAEQVTVTDTLPSGVDFISAASSDPTDICGHNAGVVNCTLGTLNPSSLATISIRVAIKPSATGTLVNQATVSSATADETPANNSFSVSTLVATRADLVLTKDDSPDPVLVGNPLNYTLTITNNGPSDAANVGISDILPASVTFSSASSDCDHSAGVVTCNLDSLARDEVKTVSIVVVPDTVGGISNSAAVFSATTDQNTGNNGDAEPTTVNPKADVLIQKSAAPDPVTAGASLTYTLLVINNGPSTASGITVVDNLPAEVNYTSATSNNGTCTYAGGTVSCSLNNLLSGENATVTIVVAVKLSFSGALANTASAAGSEADPNTANNTASQSTTVLSPDEYFSYLPLVVKPAPKTYLYIHNDNTRGNVQFIVEGTGVSCTVANNEVKFCGSFPPGIYVVQAVTSTCGTATTTKTYVEGAQTTRVFCN